MTCADCKEPMQGDGFISIRENSAMDEEVAEYTTFCSWLCAGNYCRDHDQSIEWRNQQEHLAKADKLLAIALLRAAREVSEDLRTMGFETWADKLDGAMRDAQMSATTSERHFGHLGAITATVRRDYGTIIYDCSLHGSWNASRESACPKCMIDARNALRKLNAR